MDYEKLRQLLWDQQDEIFQGIQGAIQINSVAGEPEEGAPYGPGPKKALEYALSLGEKMGFTAVNVDNQVGYLEYGQGEEMVMVLGHVDVVPVGDDWTYPPFSGKIHDHRMYGRGVSDDKGATIGAIYGLRAIRDLRIPIDRRIRVMFGTNEETGSKGVKHYVDKGEELPVMGITPDAQYPMIFFEKGMVFPSLGIANARQGKIKVLEFQGGTASNIVPLRCRLVLEGSHPIPEKKGVCVSVEDGKTVIEATGKSAHASLPHLGVNAITLLTEAVADLEIGGDFQKVIDFFNEKIGKDRTGRSLGFYAFDEETGETTVNPGTIFFDGKDLCFHFDIRYPKNGDPVQIQKALQEAFQPYGISLFSLDTSDPLYVPKDSLLIQKLMKVYQEGTGEKAEPLAIGGGTYAKSIPNMVAFGPIFPGEVDVNHQSDENLELEKLIRAIQLTACAMVEMARK